MNGQWNPLFYHTFNLNKDAGESWKKTLRQPGHPINPQTEPVSLETDPGEVRWRSRRRTISVGASLSNDEVHPTDGGDKDANSREYWRRVRSLSRENRQRQEARDRQMKISELEERRRRERILAERKKERDALMMKFLREPLRQCRIHAAKEKSKYVETKKDEEEVKERGEIEKSEEDGEVEGSSLMSSHSVPDLEEALRIVRGEDQALDARARVFISPSKRPRHTAEDKRQPLKEEKICDRFLRTHIARIPRNQPPPPFPGPSSKRRLPVPPTRPFPPGSSDDEVIRENQKPYPTRPPEELGKSRRKRRTSLGEDSLKMGTTKVLSDTFSITTDTREIETLLSEYRPPLDSHIMVLPKPRLDRRSSMPDLRDFRCVSSAVVYETIATLNSLGDARGVMVIPPRDYSNEISSSAISTPEIISNKQVAFESPQKSPKKWAQKMDKYIQNETRAVLSCSPLIGGLSPATNQKARKSQRKEWVSKHTSIKSLQKQILPTFVDSASQTEIIRPISAVSRRRNSLGSEGAESVYYDSLEEDESRNSNQRTTTQAFYVPMKNDKPTGSTAVPTLPPRLNARLEERRAASQRKPVQNPMSENSLALTGKRVQVLTDEAVLARLNAKENEMAVEQSISSIGLLKSEDGVISSDSDILDSPKVVETISNGHLSPPSPELNTDSSHSDIIHMSTPRTKGNRSNTTSISNQSKTKSEPIMAEPVSVLESGSVQVSETYTPFSEHSVPTSTLSSTQFSNDSSKENITENVIKSVQEHNQRNIVNDNSEVNAEARTENSRDMDENVVLTGSSDCSIENFEEVSSELDNGIVESLAKESSESKTVSELPISTNLNEGEHMSETILSNAEVNNSENSEDKYDTDSFQSSSMTCDKSEDDVSEAINTLVSDIAVCNESISEVEIHVDTFEPDSNDVISESDALDDISENITSENEDISEDVVQTSSDGIIEEVSSHLSQDQIEIVGYTANGREVLLESGFIDYDDASLTPDPLNINCDKMKLQNANQLDNNCDVGEQSSVLFDNNQSEKTVDDINIRTPDSALDNSLGLTDVNETESTESNELEGTVSVANRSGEIDNVEAQVSFENGMDKEGDNEVNSDHTELLIENSVPVVPENPDEIEPEELSDGTDSWDRVTVVRAHSCESNADSNAGSGNVTPDIDTDNAFFNEGDESMDDIPNKTYLIEDNINCDDSTDLIQTGSTDLLEEIFKNLTPNDESSSGLSTIEEDDEPFDATPLEEKDDDNRTLTDDDIENKDDSPLGIEGEEQCNNNVRLLIDQVASVNERDESEIVQVEGEISDAEENYDSLVIGDNSEKGNALVKGAMVAVEDGNNGLVVGFSAEVEDENGLLESSDNDLLEVTVVEGACEDLLKDNEDIEASEDYDSLASVADTHKDTLVEETEVSKIVEKNELIMVADSENIENNEDKTDEGEGRGDMNENEDLTVSKTENEDSNENEIVFVDDDQALLDDIDGNVSINETETEGTDISEPLQIPESCEFLEVHDNLTDNKDNDSQPEFGSENISSSNCNVVESCDEGENSGDDDNENQSYGDVDFTTDNCDIGDEYGSVLTQEVVEISNHNQKDAESEDVDNVKLDEKEDETVLMTDTLPLADENVNLEDDTGADNSEDKEILETEENNQLGSAQLDVEVKEVHEGKDAELDVNVDESNINSVSAEHTDYPELEYNTASKQCLLETEDSLDEPDLELITEKTVLDAPGDEETDQDEAANEDTFVDDAECEEVAVNERVNEEFIIDNNSDEESIRDTAVDGVVMDVPTDKTLEEGTVEEDDAVYNIKGGKTDADNATGESEVAEISGEVIISDDVDERLDGVTDCYSDAGSEEYIAEGDIADEDMDVHDSDDEGVDLISGCCEDIEKYIAGESAELDCVNADEVNADSVVYETITEGDPEGRLEEEIAIDSDADIETTIDSDTDIETAIDCEDTESVIVVAAEMNDIETVTKDDVIVDDSDDEHIMADNGVSDESVVDNVPNKGYVVDNADNIEIVGNTPSEEDVVLSCESNEKGIVDDTIIRDIVLDKIDNDETVTDHMANEDAARDMMGRDECITDITSNEEFLIEDVTEEGDFDESVNEETVIDEANAKESAVHETATESNTETDAAKEEFIVDEVTNDETVINEELDEETTIAEMVYEEVVTDNIVEEETVIKDIIDEDTDVNEADIDDTCIEEVASEETVMDATGGEKQMVDTGTEECLHYGNEDDIKEEETVIDDVSSEVVIDDVVQDECNSDNGNEEEGDREGISDEGTVINKQNMYAMVDDEDESDEVIMDDDAGGEKCLVDMSIEESSNNEEETVLDDVTNAVVIDDVVQYECIADDTNEEEGDQTDIPDEGTVINKNIMYAMMDDDDESDEAVMNDDTGGETRMVDIAIENSLDCVKEEDPNEEETVIDDLSNEVLIEDVVQDECIANDANDANEEKDTVKVDNDEYESDEAILDDDTGDEKHMVDMGTEESLDYGEENVLDDVTNEAVIEDVVQDECIAVDTNEEEGDTDTIPYEGTVMNKKSMYAMDDDDDDGDDDDDDDNDESGMHEDTGGERHIADTGTEESLDNEEETIMDDVNNEVLIDDVVQDECITDDTNEGECDKNTIPDEGIVLSKKIMHAIEDDDESNEIEEEMEQTKDDVGEDEGAFSLGIDTPKIKDIRQIGEPTDNLDPIENHDDVFAHSEEAMLDRILGEFSRKEKNCLEQSAVTDIVDPDKDVEDRDDLSFRRKDLSGNSSPDKQIASNFTCPDSDVTSPNKCSESIHASESEISDLSLLSNGTQDITAPVTKADYEEWLDNVETLIEKKVFIGQHKVSRSFNSCQMMDLPIEHRNGSASTEASSENHEYKQSRISTENQTHDESRPTYNEGANSLMHVGESNPVSYCDRGNNSSELEHLKSSRRVALVSSSSNDSPSDSPRDGSNRDGAAANSPSSDSGVVEMAGKLVHSPTEGSREEEAIPNEEIGEPRTEVSPRTEASSIGFQCRKPPSKQAKDRANRITSARRRPFSASGHSTDTRDPMTARGWASLQDSNEDIAVSSRSQKRHRGTYKHDDFHTYPPQIDSDKPSRSKHQLVQDYLDNLPHHKRSKDESHAGTAGSPPRSLNDLPTDNLSDFGSSDSGEGSYSERLLRALETRRLRRHRPPSSNIDHDESPGKYRPPSLSALDAFLATLSRYRGGREGEDDSREDTPSPLLPGGDDVTVQVRAGPRHHDVRVSSRRQVRLVVNVSNPGPSSDSGCVPDTTSQSERTATAGREVPLSSRGEPMTNHPRHRLRPRTEAQPSVPSRNKAADDVEVDQLLSDVREYLNSKMKRASSSREPSPVEPNGEEIFVEGSNIEKCFKERPSAGGRARLFPKNRPKQEEQRRSRPAPSTNPILKEQQKIQSSIRAINTLLKQFS